MHPDAAAATIFGALAGHSAPDQTAPLASGAAAPANIAWDRSGICIGIRTLSTWMAAACGWLTAGPRVDPSLEGHGCVWGRGGGTRLLLLRFSEGKNIFSVADDAFSHRAGAPASLAQGMMALWGPPWNCQPKEVPECRHRMQQKQDRVYITV